MLLPSIFTHKTNYNFHKNEKEWMRSWGWLGFNLRTKRLVIGEILICKLCSSKQKKMGARFSFHGLVDQDHQFSSSADPEPEAGDNLEREMDESQESSCHHQGHRTVMEVCFSFGSKLPDSYWGLWSWADLVCAYNAWWQSMFTASMLFSAVAWIF